MSRRTRSVQWTMRKGLQGVRSLLLSIGLLCSVCPANAVEPPLPPLPAELWGHWVHSFEEDTPTVRVYRPRSYEFPLARGREGLELRENGEYVRYDIARGDGNLGTSGSWKRLGPATIEVVVTRDGRTEREVLRILSCADGVLKLAR